MHPLYVRRQWVALLFLAVHGLALAAAGAILAISGAVQSLDTESEFARVRRTPTTAEAARGEAWMNGTIVSFGILAPPSGGPKPETDPWQHCALRRQTYRSGKNSGWYEDGTTWSYGSAIIEGQGQTAEVPLYGVSGAPGTLLSNDEAARLLPKDPPTSATRYARVCFTTGQTVTVDGARDADGVVRGVHNRTLARLERPEERLARTGTSQLLDSLAPLLLFAPLVWLGAMLAFFRQPFALSRALQPFVEPSRSVARGAQVGVAAGVLLGLAFWALTGAPGTIFAPILPSVVIGTLAGFVQSHRTILRRARMLLAGRPMAGTIASTGTIANEAQPRPPFYVPLPAPLSFAQTWIFEHRGRGIGPRIRAIASANEIEGTGEHGAFGCASAALATVYAPWRQVGETTEIAGSRGMDCSGLGAGMHWFKESVIPVGSPLTIIGRSATVADASTAEDYRASGKKRLYDASETDKPVVVIASSLEALDGLRTRDLTTLGVLFGLAALWLASPLMTAALLLRSATLR